MNNETSSPFPRFSPEKTVEEQKPKQKEIKKEPKKEVVDDRPHVILSHTDAYVHDRMKSQPESLEKIDLQVVPTADPTKHRLSLPDDFEPYKKKYAFRWIFKNKQAIDHACNVRGWVLANRTYFEDLPNHLFTANGSIEIGDNILGFMPKERAEKLRRAPGEKSAQIVEGMLGKHADDPRYYTPEDSNDKTVRI